MYQSNCFLFVDMEQRADCCIADVEVTVDVRCCNSPNKFVLSSLGNSPLSNWNQPPLVGLLSERRHDEL